MATTSDVVREAYIAWLSVWEAERGRAMTPTESNAAWAAYQSAHRAGKVAGMREAARECQRAAPVTPGRFDPDERAHERCAERCAAAIRALAAKEEA